MATASKSCGVCELRHITKPSVVWCSECDEGLCTECKEHHSLSKASRSHGVIHIAEYQKLPADVLKITQYCIKHDKKYQMYCQKHEFLCCNKCIVESHKECRDFVELDDVINNVKTSYAMCEIEETLSEVAENLQKIRQNQQDNLTNFKESRKVIETEIKKTRIKINNHLDKLQEDLLKKLYAVEEKENSKICQLLSSLEKKEKEIAECQRNIVNIKKHATDLQVFLSMKKIEEDVNSKNKFLQSLVEGNNLKIRSLSYKINTSIKNIMFDVKSLGEVRIKDESSNIGLIRKKARQAQMMVPNVQSIEKLELTLNRTINTKAKATYGCCILSDGRMAFTDFHDQSIKLFSSQGFEDFEVKIHCNPFDIVYIIEDNTLAVTSGNSDEQCISIIDLERKNIKKTISLDSYNYGIALTDNRLIYCAYNRGIRMINLSDESKSDLLRDTKMPSECYIATLRDKVYHTNREMHTVTCCNLQGTIQWTFQDESVIIYPRGIDVDNDGNVYVVVGNTSHNVVILSPDGKRHRDVLPADGDLNDPNPLHYSGRKNQLLVSNYDNTACLFGFN